ncbi:MAG: class I SAM-dependent methyltransferase [Thermoleophilia bacterium]|nr:class I SAM-dependent methyltransferase [Thermoleophilia bacterium]
MALDRQITVTEISNIRAARISDTYSGDAGVSVVLHNLEEGTGFLNGQLFDAIVVNAMVEYLVDPIQALIMTRGLMRAGAHLLLTTPNVAKWTRPPPSCSGGDFPAPLR